MENINIDVQDNCGGKGKGGCSVDVYILPQGTTEAEFDKYVKERRELSKEEIEPLNKAA